MVEFEVFLQGGSPWGFRLQGGREFRLPLKIAKVEPSGKAYNGGVQVGDHLQEIDGISTERMYHTEALSAVKKAQYSLSLLLSRPDGNGENATNTVQSLGITPEKNSTRVSLMIGPKPGTQNRTTESRTTDDIPKEDLDIPQGQTYMKKLLQRGGGSHDDDLEPVSRPRSKTLPKKMEAKQQNQSAPEMQPTQPHPEYSSKSLPRNQKSMDSPSQKAPTWYRDMYKEMHTSMERESHLSKLLATDAKKGAFRKYDGATTTENLQNAQDRHSSATYEDAPRRLQGGGRSIANHPNRKSLPNIHAAGFNFMKPFYTDKSETANKGPPVKSDWYRQVQKGGDIPEKGLAVKTTGDQSDAMNRRGPHSPKWETLVTAPGEATPAWKMEVPRPKSISIEYNNPPDFLELRKQELRNMDIEKEKEELRILRAKERLAEEERQLEQKTKEFIRIEEEKERLRLKEEELKRKEEDLMRQAAEQEERLFLKRKEDDLSEQIRREFERGEKERRDAQKREAERREAERQEFERREAERREFERMEAERREAERREAERREAEREAERKAAERREAERKENERRQAERREAERREAEERERLRLETQRREAEQRENARREAERIEAERKEAAIREAERREAEWKEIERKEAERKEAERREQEMIEELEKSKARLPSTGKAKYSFHPQGLGELSFKKGDIISIIGQIDENWLEGENKGNVGIFPVTYIELIPDAPDKTAENVAKTNAKNLIENEKTLNYIEDELLNQGANLANESLQNSLPVRDEVDVAINTAPLESTPAMIEAEPVIVAANESSLESGVDVDIACNGIQNGGVSPRSRLPSLVEEGHAVARYTFKAEAETELSFKKGEEITLLKKVDDNWYEGELNGKIGLLPANYVKVKKEPVFVVPEEPVIVSAPPSPASPVSPVSPSSNAKPVIDIPMPADILKGKKPESRKNSAEYLLDSVLNAHAAEKKSKENPGLVNGHDHTNNADGKNVIDELIGQGEPYKAIYKYASAGEDEIELVVGDVVQVLEKCDDNWFIGTSQRTGAFGMFPGNYVVPL